MQNQISPLIVSFGATDPVGAQGLFADQASFAAMGCHGLPVVTAILTGDTAQTDSLYPIDADLIDDQARTVLEDMQVAAIKVGLVGSVENVTVIAEIAADYPDQPLVLDPVHTELDEQTPDAEDLLTAIQELLLPQASLLVISAVELARMSASGDEAPISEDLSASVMSVIDGGCEHVLVTGTTSEAGEIENQLFGPSGLMKKYAWPRVPGTHCGAGSTLSAAIAALLANGMEMADAVLEAQEYTHATLRHSQQLGMGKRVPDRFFWAKESAEPAKDQPFQSESTPSYDQ